MPDNLKDLSEKIAGFRRKSGVHPQKANKTGINAGAQAGLELVTSIIAGALIGYGLDRWLDTKPWLLILFTFLGVGAGFMGVWRITNDLGSSVGFASLQKPEKTATKPPQTADEDE